MRTPPRLSAATIRAVLHDQFGVAVATLQFLPIGNDLASFVYRVEATDGVNYFLKARARAGFRLPSLAVPRFLHERGMPHIVAPLLTTNATLWAQVGDFALTLYPFLDARTAAAAGLSPHHWHALGATVRQIHTIQLPADLDQIIPRETCVPSRRHVLNDFQAAIDRGDQFDALGRELVAFWHARHDLIRHVIDRAEALGDHLRQASLPLALCHADLHTWNVLLDDADQIWIVDWDEVILAPKERDLMFVIGGIGRGLVDPQETASFLRGYGDPRIDDAALRYYRYAWAVQDMGAYAEQALFAPDQSEQSRRDALEGLIDLFAPGNIVAIALDGDHSAR